MRCIVSESEGGQHDWQIDSQGMRHQARNAETDKIATERFDTVKLRTRVHFPSVSQSRIVLSKLHGRRSFFKLYCP